MKKPRPKEKTYIFGRKAVQAAIEEGEALEKILILSGGRSGFYKEILGIAQQAEIPVKKVPREKMDWLTQKDHEGIVAFRAPVTYQKLEDVLSQVYEQGQIPLFVILDGVTDVRNVGAIARSALCFGAHALVTPYKDSAEINQRTVESSAGALLELPICRMPEAKDAIEYLKSNGLTIYGTQMEADTDVDEMPVDVPMALVMGDEGKGISAKVLALCDEKISIPMHGHFDSLNVSVAAAICLYEISKRRE